MNKGGSSSSFDQKHANSSDSGSSSSRAKKGKECQRENRLSSRERQEVSWQCGLCGEIIAVPEDGGRGVKRLHDERAKHVRAYHEGRGKACGPARIASSRNHKGH
eukprot:15475960-Alexandrium_andersonii.AAC.1